MASRSASKSSSARLEAGTPPVAAASLPRLTEPCYCALARQASRSLTDLYERELAPFNITLPQFSLLRAAGALGPVTISEMAGKLKLDRTTLGRNLKLLEKDGLVEFLDNELDQRERLVGLTKAGGKLGEQAFAAWSAAQAKVKRGLSRQKLEVLREIVEEIEGLDA
jgi:DNA-binding MarR family transcriptional regulator